MAIDLVEAVDLAVLGDRDLEAGICGFQARLSAGVAVYVLAIAEFDRRGLWERWECRSMAHYLGWKCGTGLVAAREQVRVGRALAELPVIRERFRTGTLSYSQVRALTRAAGPDTEELLADMAAYMTAVELERVVRAYRRSGRIREEAAEQRRARRHLSYHFDDDGMLVGHFALPAEEGAVLAKAIDGQVTPERVREAEQDRAKSCWGAARADALVRLAQADLAASEDGGDGDDRYLVTVLVDRDTLAGQASEGAEVTCQVEDGPGLATDTVRRLACDSATMEVIRDRTGNVLDMGRRTRRIGRRLRRALQLRDRGCRFPGCSSTRTQAHHIRHWADGGSTNMDNLVSLCSRHHHRHHEGGFTIEHAADGRLRFVQANGRLVPDHVGPAVPVPPGGGLPVTEQPFDSKWQGGPLPLADILTVLHQAVGTLDGPRRDSAEASVTG